jgi:hypothetical protein
MSRWRVSDGTPKPVTIHDPGTGEIITQDAKTFAHRFRENAPRLSPSMWDTLERAAKQPLRRTHDDTPGAKPYPAPWQSLRALVRHGLLKAQVIRNRKGRPTQVWSPTPAGLQLLNPPAVTRSEEVRLLARTPQPIGPNASEGASSYTSDPSRAIDELEAVDPAEIDAARRHMARELHADASDRRVAARRLARNARRAA